MRFSRKPLMITAAVVLLFIISGLIFFGGRGMIRVTIQNDLDSDIELSFLQNIPVHETVKPHQSTDYRYRILRGENVLSVRSMIEG